MLEEEGKSFGAKTDQVGCLDEAIRRLEGTVGAVDEVGNRMFLTGCLDTAELTDDFCVGVPSETDIVDGSAWVGATCTEYEKGGDQSCHQLVAQVQKFCTAVFGP